MPDYEPTIPEIIGQIFEEYKAYLNEGYDVHTSYFFAKRTITIGKEIGANQHALAREMNRFLKNFDKSLMFYLRPCDTRV